MKYVMMVMSIVLLMILGCGERADRRVFHLATNVWPGYEALNLAQEEKLYNENIKVTTYDSATVVLNKFRKKVIDAAAVTLDEAILLHDQGYKPRIIAVMDISNGADALIVHPGIKRLSDLKDKSIGVENTALGSYILARVLEKARLSFEDIILVPVAVNNHEEAFKKKVIDAVITFEPVRSNLLQTGGVEIFSSKDIPGEIVDVLVVQDNMFKTKYVTDILDAWKKASLQISQRDPDAIRLISKRLNQSEEEFIASLEGLKIPSLEESNSLISDGKLQNTIAKIGDIMYEKKLIKSKIDPVAMIR